MRKKEIVIFLFLKNKKFFTLRVSVKDSLKGGCAGEVYPGNLKNGDFDKEAFQIFCPRQVTVLQDTAQAVNKKFEARPMKSKPIFQVPWVQLDDKRRTLFTEYP